MGGLPQHCNKDSLSAYFSQFGEVEDVDIRFDPNTNRNRGFGFVTFISGETAKSLLNSGNSHFIEGKKVNESFCHNVEIIMLCSNFFEKYLSSTLHILFLFKQVELKVAYKKGEEAVVQEYFHGRKVFVGGLTKEATKEKLFEYFGAYGTVCR